MDMGGCLKGMDPLGLSCVVDHFLYFMMYCIDTNFCRTLFLQIFRMSIRRNTIMNICLDTCFTYLCNI